MTEDLQKYAERLAEKHADLEWSRFHGNEAEGRKVATYNFLQGFYAAQEVFELRGRIAALKELWERKPNGTKLAFYMAREAEARLASLLGSEGRDE